MLMPQDRFRSQRAGSSQKLSALTDFEYRVWDQYQLSADDFGIMPCEAIQLQADNMALRAPRRTEAEVQEALERFIAIKLVFAYEHQHRRYIVDPKWQHFQRVSYPKQTMNPAPPADVLAQCHVWTQALFAQCFGKKSQKFSKPPENSEIFQNPSEGMGSDQVANGKEIAAKTNGKGQMADGAVPTTALTLVPSPPTWIGRFDEFWAAYPRRVGKEDARKKYQRLNPDATLHTQVLAAIDRHKRLPQWLKDNGEYIPHPTTWLNKRRWEDEPATALQGVRATVSPTTENNMRALAHLLRPQAVGQ